MVNGKSSVLLWPKEENPTSLVCLRKEDMKRFEETEDCFILDFDPYDSFNFSKLSLDHKINHQTEDVCIVGENSQVNTLQRLLSLHGLCFLTVLFLKRKHWCFLWKFIIVFLQIYR